MAGAPWVTATGEQQQGEDEVLGVPRSRDSSSSSRAGSSAGSRQAYFLQGLNVNENELQEGTWIVQEGGSRWAELPDCSPTAIGATAAPWAAASFSNSSLCGRQSLPS